MTHITEMLQNIVAGNLTESTKAYNTILMGKVKDKLKESKMTVASSLMTEKSSSDDDSDDAEDESIKMHPMVQLKHAADTRKLADDETKEYKLDGSVDGRSSKSVEYKLPEITHTDGTKSTISPDHAQLIVNLLHVHKPAEREELVNKIGSSAAELEKARRLAVHYNLPEPKED